MSLLTICEMRLGLRPRSAIAFVLLLSLSTGCVAAAEPSVEQASRDVARLSGLLPTLADLRITMFRNQEWCQAMEYSRGTFSNVVDDAVSCTMSLTPAVSFDQIANSDFKRVADELAATGVGVFMISSIGYDESENIAHAVFSFSGGAFDRFAYLYDMDGALPKGTDRDTLAIWQVVDGWWFVSQDWN